ncbi:hypothetical protein STEG23_000847, partial [Scotinomys teguina]
TVWGLSFHVCTMEQQLYCQHLCFILFSSVREVVSQQKAMSSDDTDLIDFQQGFEHCHGGVGLRILKFGTFNMLYYYNCKCYKLYTPQSKTVEDTNESKWKELENIILSEVTQTQKDKHAPRFSFLFPDLTCGFSHLHLKGKEKGLSLDPCAGYHADTRQYRLPQSLFSDAFVNE